MTLIMTDDARVCVCDVVWVLPDDQNFDDR
jgi:hypothetical protein